MQEDIKLKIGADTTQAKKDINKLNNEKIEIKTEFKKPKNYLKEIEQEANRLGEKVKEIKLNKKAFTTDDIKILKSEIESVASKAQLIYFTKGNESALKLNQRLKEMHKTLGQTKKEVKNTENIFLGMNVAIGNLVSTGIMKMVAGLKQATLEGAKLSRDLEYSIEKIKTISDSGRGNISQEIEFLGKKYGIDYREISEGLYQTVSAIGDINKKYALLDTANKLAKTGFSSVNESVDGLTTVLNAYGLEVEEAERIANIFVRTQKVGKLTVQEFQQQLYKTVPVARELGIQIDEIGASIALLTAKGSKAEVAQTQMAAFMYELLDTSSEVSKAFRYIAGQTLQTFMENGGSQEEIMKLLQQYEKISNIKIESMFGRKEAKSYWLAVGKDLNGYKEKLEAINSPVNELQKNIENLLSTTEARIERSKRYWDSLKTKIGDVANSVFVDFADMITGFDKQTSAQKRVIELTEQYLNILKEYGSKNDITSEEQELLNDALRQLDILAPDIMKVYNEFITKGGQWAEVIKQINQEHLKLYNNSASLTGKEYDEQIKQLEKQKQDLDKKLTADIESKAQGIKYQSLEKKFKNGTLTDTEKIDYLNYQNKISQIEKQIENLNSEREKRLKEFEEKYVLNTAEKENKGQENIDKSVVVNQPITKPIKTNETLKSERDKILKLEDDRLVSYISSRKKVNYEDLKKDVEFNKEQAKTEYEIQKLMLEVDSLKRSISNETNKDILQKTNEEIGYKENLINSLKNEKIISAHEYNLEKLEKEKEKIQLDIQNKFNDLAISEKQAFNEKMTKLIQDGNIKEIEEAQKKHEANLKMIEKERQLAELRLKLDDNSLTKEEKTQVQLQMNKIQTDFEANKIQEDLKDSQDNLKKSLDNVSSNLRNLSSLFQTIGDNTGSAAIKNLANIGSLGSTIFDTIKNSSQGEALLESIFGKGTEKIAGFENFTMGAGIGSALSGTLGGGAEGNIGSTLGSAVGTIVGGPVGSVVGGVLGSAVGSVFGRKSKKKKKREERKRRAAQERLKQGMISGQFKWADVLQEYNEDLQRAGMGEYIGLLDKVSVNTDYDNVRSILNGAKRGADGVSMSALKQLMPQYTESQIMDWFKSITGGAVLNGDTLSTGEGKYGAIDISALAQQVTNANREMEQSLKDTIKNIIDFSADSLAQVVKEGFFDGLDNLGDNIEKMIANSLKNAFLNTELSKNLFNGLSDKVSDYVKELFKNDKNLGIDLETGSLEKLTFTQYIELIKKYMEMSNDKLEELFKELGLNMDNLTQSMDSLNKNMSKNVVSGIATNLWKQNLGIKEPYKINQNIHLEIPVVLNGKEMDRYIIKTVNGSLQRSRRSGNGIGRG